MFAKSFGIERFKERAELCASFPDQGQNKGSHFRPSFSGCCIRGGMCSGCEGGVVEKEVRSVLSLVTE